jgi:predicted Zn-dependent peptidase
MDRITSLTTLNNGLRIVTETMPGAVSVSLGAWVGVGTRHEAVEVNGISHLLEHMVFKGTRRRSAEQIAVEIEAVGGQINAYTGRENTAYYVRVLAENLVLGTDIIADIVQHAALPEDELVREREVVLQEIGMSMDTPDDIIFDHFQHAAFPSQAMGRPVLGHADVVGSMSREALAGHRRCHYTPQNLVVAAAGQVEHQTFVDLVVRSFADLPPSQTRASEPSVYRGGEYREAKDLEQIHLLLGFEGLRFHHADVHAAQLLSTALGGGMSSRLFQEIREKRGLVYSVYSFMSSYLDSGLFGIYAGTGPDEIGTLVPVMCEEVRRIGMDLREEELERAKAQLRAMLLMGGESTCGRCEALAQHVLIHGKPLPTAEIIGKINAVDIEQTRRVARDLFAGAPTVAMLGPVMGVEDHSVIMDRLRA